MLQNLSRESGRSRRIRTRGLSLMAAAALVLAGLSLVDREPVTDALAAAGTSYQSTVTVPEHPEGEAFNPTQISELQPAVPGAGVNLIEVPTANNQGDARLGYPLEVPPGRNGVQPELALGYNSSGGNGWTGVGWDLSLPVIQVDTRWGVPRYDAALETESYLLNGEQLTPLAHRGELRPRSAAKVFHTRVEGGFRRIVRHGDSPASYSWEVTDKDGTTHLYGGAPGTFLADDAGHRAVWALRESRDLNGNFVRYDYARVDDAGVDGSSVTGRNLYPQRITWTGHGVTEGRYSVTFVRDRERGEPRRRDVGIDARMGFKRVTADLLRRVEVKYDDQLVRAYELDYRTGAFEKTLLAGVTQLGSANTPFATHTFDYFDDIRDASGAYRAFDDADGWTVPDDSLGRAIGGSLTESGALSSSTSRSTGMHLYVGWNPAEVSKSNSVGVKVGANSGTSDGLLALADVDGDNLPDKVFRKGGDIHYRPNLSGPGGEPRFGAAVRLDGLAGISRERTRSGTVGVESYFGVAAQIDHVSTTSTSDQYFSDVNADGITDLVSNGRVSFGHLDADGHPTYTPNSADTPVPVGTGTIDGPVVGDTTAEFEQLVSQFPLLDSVRRWVAPYDGTVRVDGGVRLVEDTSPERAEYTRADGVRVTVQHEDDELWAQRIGPDDRIEFHPTGVGSIAVSKGDAVYFRVQSVLDGRFDTVAWDPQVTYTGMPEGTDANGLPATVFRASSDFTLGGRASSVVAPLTGTIHLTGDVVKSAATTDDVRVRVTRNGTPVFSHDFPAADAGTAAIDLQVPVTEGDELSFRLASDSPIDLATLQWVPVAAYSAADGLDSVVDAEGNPTIVLQAPYDADMYPASTLTAPQQGWTPGSTEPVQVQPELAFDFGAGSPDATVHFTVKRRGGLVAKQAIEIVDGVVPAIPALTVPGGTDELFFDFATRDPKLLAALTSQSVTVDGAPVPSALHAAVGQDVFAQPYRGWAAVGYQANKARATEPIHQGDLVLTAPPSQDEITEADLPADGEPPVVEAPKVVVLAPVPAAQHWGGADENTWVAAGSASSSRLGLDTLDVATDADYAGASAVDRRSRTTQLSTTLGVGPVGGSLAKGTTEARTDFIDLNGDRFPDVVGSGGIQYSDMVGGLGSTRGSLGSAVRKSGSTAYSVSASGGSPARTSATARGQAAPSAGRNANTAKSGTEMPALGVGGNLGGGDSDTSYDLIDVNGDGLPDKVYDDGDAALNLGYSFAGREPWGLGALNEGGTRNASVSGNIGFNTDYYEFAGGVNASIGTSWTDSSLLDMNGDGLTDRVLTRDGQPVAVGLNTGSGFAAPTPFHGARSDIAQDENAALGGGVYFTFGFCTVVAGCFVFNPGADVSTGIGRSEVALRDVNGDGLADHVKSTSDDELLVSENRTGRTNLLRSVDRPMGARIDLDYERSGNTYDQPDSRWVLTRAVVEDGHAGDGADRMVSTFTYADGVQDRLEREFLGYGRVVTEQRDPGQADAVYRRTVQEFRTDSVYTKGLQTRSLTTDAAERPFTETLYDYELRDVATGGAANADSTTATVFPMLTRQDSRFYEGQTSPGKTTYVEKSYDGFGNLVRTFDAGDAGAADDLEALSSYDVPEACRAKHLVGIATSSRARHEGQVLRRSEASLDCATGDVTQVREYVDGTTAAVTDIAWHPNGTLRTVTSPPNKSGQRSTLTYDYDADVQTHVARIVDNFGYTSSFTHDPRFGQPLETTDENSQKLTLAYDEFGRIDHVVGPYEQGSDRLTVDYEYHPEAGTPYAVTRQVDRAAEGVRADTIDTIQFADGLGRVLQIKKDASVAAAAGEDPADVMTVSGRAVLDFAGRVVEQFYPVTEPKGPANTSFSPAVDTVTPTRVRYDVMDRTVLTTMPDSTTTKAFYGFGADRTGRTQFMTVSTDANDKQRRVFLDVRGLTTAVKEYNPAGGQAVIWTSYAHDPLMQVVRVTDDQGNDTLSEYDALGRRTAMVSPDSGRTVSRFDLAGQLVAKQTAKLAAQGQWIEYDYDFDRLTKVRYPVFSGNNVTYTYGPPGATGNAANRVTRIVDAAGSVSRSYGPLGEVVSETREVTAIRTPARTYTTTYRHDTLNRVLQMTYPDGEVLTYDYDSGGAVRRATGRKGSDDYVYLARQDYDKFGQRILSESGTGVRSTYTYDAEDRQLKTLSSRLPDGYQFQNLRYGYDKAGNVTSLTNAVTQQDGKPIGGGSQQTFEYDDLYRLTAATGRYQKADTKVDSYSMALTYDSIHNALTKSQQHQITVGESLDLSGWEAQQAEPAPEPITLEDGTTFLPPEGVIAEPEEPTTADTTATESGTTTGTTTGTESGTGTPDAQPGGHTQVQRGTTYDYTYAYGGRPHAPTKIGPVTQAYDANGNLVDEVNTLPPAPGKRRQLVWDEENRLACNQDHSRNTTVAQAPATCSTPKQPPTVRYAYDSTGNRVVKDSGQVSIYPNRAYSERNGTGYKHVYIGDSRIATKMVKPDSTYENHQWFFHPDHLGSSSFVTDEHAQLTEHLEYFAFGETWVNEHPAQPTGMPFQFGGKELDDETGLYYYGARYYNPRTQLWASPDPILGEYLDGNTNGGVYNPVNLAAYTYAFNNPVRLTDPNGEAVSWRDIGHAALDVAGLVPVIGEAADLANAGWYAAEGDYVNAGLSAASAVPFAGYAATAAKVAKRGADAVGAVRTANRATQAARAGAKAADTAATAGRTTGRAATQASGTASTATRTAARACSFAGSTVVLMADGSRKPIEEVEVGDEVIATDPETGEQVAKRVTHVFVHEDSVVELEIDGEVVSTTEDHPFWSVTDQRFERADELAPGERVLGADGRVLTVSSLELSDPRRTFAYNLSVEGIHTYHVGAGAILVHNSCPLPLDSVAKKALRAEATAIWQSAKGWRASWKGMEVHHRIPLEWAHLMPGAPNRVANLVGMKNANHTLVSNAWAAWKRSLNGRTPTQAEIMKQALNIDRQFGHLMEFVK